jgi:hypothetical protein
MTYGLPHHLIAMLSSDGSLKTKNILEWIKTRKNLEAHIASEGNFKHLIFLLPSRKSYWGGENQQLTILVVTFDFMTWWWTNVCLYLYNNSKKRGKTEISMEVVRRTKATSGRFLLTQIKGVWVGTSDDDARDKVSHLFRNRRRRAQRDHDTKEKVIVLVDNPGKRLKLV